jgi:hypothetical protein
MAMGSVFSDSEGFDIVIGLESLAPIAGGQSTVPPEHFSQAGTAVDLAQCDVDGLGFSFSPGEGDHSLEQCIVNIQCHFHAASIHITSISTSIFSFFTPFSLTPRTDAPAP